MPTAVDFIFDNGLFDDVWYARRFPDVALTGLEPRHHFRTYGYPVLRRAPNSRAEANGAMLDALYEAPAEPSRALERADQIETVGNSKLALAYADLYLPKHARHTENIIRANAALSARDETGWLIHVNDFLSHFGSAPLTLATGDGPLIGRIGTAALPPVTGGPLVSVIMPAWNAEEWLEMAVRSILDQSWRNLELIVVDDASTDGTWHILKRLAAADNRLRIRRNSVNAGPYVAKNLAVDMAQGSWITGHDADDWAHPRRIEAHMHDVMAAPTAPRASLTYMVRIQPSGRFDTITQMSDFSPDGVTRVSSISTLFAGDFLRRDLGYWDSVRYGADSEMIARARKILGDEFRQYPQIGMICLSTETGLTNRADSGLRSNEGRPVRNRSAYKTAWTKAHKSAKNPSGLFLPFPQKERRYTGDFTHAVPYADLEALIRS